MAKHRAERSRPRQAAMVTVTCAVLALAAGAPSMERPQNLGILGRAAAAARETGDWARVREIYAVVAEIAPGHPAVHARMAQTLAELGDLDGALASLERVAELGGVTDLLDDPLLRPVAASERARRLAARLEENARPRPAAEVVVTFEDRDLFPEGIARDAATGDLYVGSFHRRRIVRVTVDGRVEVLGDPERQELRAVLGLWVDADRRRLWAVSANGPGAPEDAPSPEIVQLSLPDGRVVGRHPAPADGVTRMLNDVTASPDGTVWATESLHGELYRLAPDGSELELFRAYPGFGFANGVAVSADGATVYVAHAEGLTAIDAVSGEPERVSGPPDLSLVAADGLSLAPGGLVLVQNQPSLGNRTIFVELDATGRTATGHRVLDAGVPEGLLPFTSAVGDGWVHLVASPPSELAGSEVDHPAPAIVRCRLP